MIPVPMVLAFLAGGGFGTLGNFGVMLLHRLISDDCRKWQRSMPKLHDALRSE